MDNLDRSHRNEKNRADDLVDRVATFTFVNYDELCRPLSSKLMPPYIIRVVNYYQPFIGLLSQKEAEDLLTDEKEGTFLMRITERLWSYTISCKTSRGIKHYLIDASNGNYRLLASDQMNHLSLGKY